MKKRWVLDILPFNNLLFGLILLGNNWVWKIAGLNLFVFLILIFTTLLLWFFLFKSFKKNLFYIGLTLLGILLIFQWKTSTEQSLILLENDEQRIQSERFKYYNPSLHYARVLFARLNLINFLEGDFNTVSTRLQRNFFETIDPNVYFFGGHPRERVWANDFEKFYFILIVPFFVGLYYLILNRKKFVLIYSLISISSLTLIGHKNLMGPFILFPLFVICIWYGILKLLKYET